MPMKTIASPRLAFLVAALGLAAACKEKSAGQPVVDAAVSATSAPAPAPGSEEEQILKESKNRPSIPFTVERVVKAINDAGIKTEDNRAVLAADVEARYCRNVRVPEYTIVLVICEYQTPEDANHGREVALEKYKGQPGRETYVNGATTMSIVLKRQGMPSTDEWGKKIVDAFTSMK